MLLILKSLRLPFMLLVLYMQTRCATSTDVSLYILYFVLLRWVRWLICLSFLQLN